MRSILILGLDPGSRYTGYGLVESTGQTLKAVAYGRFSLPGAKPLATRLASLQEDVTNLIARWQPDVAVLETAFHGRNTRSLVVLAQARGALLATLGGSGIEIDEYSPAEVKSAVTGSGRADKEQVARMVQMHLSLAEARLDPDAADALAVAICFAQRHRMDDLLERRKRR